MNLRIKKIIGKKSNGNVWVQGFCGEIRFEALVFEEHAESESYEIGRSRISKLWLHDGKVTVYNWDRGLDVAATTETAKLAVAVITGLLAERVFGKIAN